VTVLLSFAGGSIDSVMFQNVIEWRWIAFSSAFEYFSYATLAAAIICVYVVPNEREES
jgi:hypothetical protein